MLVLNGALLHLQNLVLLQMHCGRWSDARPQDHQLLRVCYLFLQRLYRLRPLPLMHYLLVFLFFSILVYDLRVQIVALDVEVPTARIVLRIAELFSHRWRHAARAVVLT